MTLTTYGKDDQVASSVSWLSIEVHNGSSILEGDSVNKSSVKVWKSSCNGYDIRKWEQ